MHDTRKMPACEKIRKEPLSIEKSLFRLNTERAFFVDARLEEDARLRDVCVRACVCVRGKMRERERREDARDEEDARLRKNTVDYEKSLFRLIAETAFFN